MLKTGSDKIKFIYSEKATKFCEISTVDLTVTTQDKSKVVIFVPFSQNLNFNGWKNVLIGNNL